MPLRGRNAPVVKFPLKWAHEYRATPLPAPTFPIDVSEGITDFGMMGNDEYGNCGSCGEVHEEMTTAKAAGTTGPEPSSTEGVSRYVDYTGDKTPPGPGVDLASYLLWCVKKGYIKAFAPVDVSDKATMQGLMAAGYGLYIGVNLTDQNEDQFNNGTPWTSAGGPDPNDGHCVLWVQSQAATGPHGVVTWGKVQPAEDDWIEQCLISNADGEAFLVVTTEEQLAEWDQSLLADVQALGGTEPAPEPTSRTTCPERLLSQPHRSSLRPRPLLYRRPARPRLHSLTDPVACGRSRRRR